MCPKRDCQEVMAKTVFGSDGLRIKFCPNCHTMYHRDVMAGENMINVFLAIVENDDWKARPKYLARPNQGVSKPPGSSTSVKTANQNGIYLRLFRTSCTSIFS